MINKSVTIILALAIIPFAMMAAIERAQWDEGLIDDYDHLRKPCQNTPKKYINKQYITIEEDHYPCDHSSCDHDYNICTHSECSVPKQNSCKHRVDHSKCDHEKNVCIVQDHNPNEDLIYVEEESCENCGQKTTCKICHKNCDHDKCDLCESPETCVHARKVCTHHPVHKSCHCNNTDENIIIDCKNSNCRCDSVEEDHHQVKHVCRKENKKIHRPINDDQIIDEPQIKDHRNCKRNELEIYETCDVCNPRCDSCDSSKKCGHRRKVCVHHPLHKSCQCKRSTGDIDLYNEIDVEGILNGEDGNDKNCGCKILEDVEVDRYHIRHGQYEPCGRCQGKCQGHQIIYQNFDE